MAVIEVSTIEGGKTELSNRALDAFRGQLEGRLLLPDDAGFDEATLIWNGMINKKPALVVQPAGVRDVVASVDFARGHHLLLSVKGGGHNLGGTALTDGGLTMLDRPHVYQSPDGRR